MSLAEIMAETKTLAPSEQKEFAAFLTVLRMKSSGDWEQAIVEEKREGWVSLEEGVRQKS